MELRKSIKKSFIVEETVQFGEALCEALSYAHQHTVHRDVKPENIWLNPDDSVKLMDFGIARLLSTSQLTMTGTSMGTAYYLAPEQLKGAKHVDGRADQYAVAAVLYETLTGDVPAGMMEPVHALHKDVPRRLGEAIGKALRTKPEDRFADISAFATSLSAAKGRSLRLPSFTGRKRAIAAAVLAALLLAGTAPLWFEPVKGLISKLTSGPAVTEEQILDLLAQSKSTLSHLELARREFQGKVKESQNRVDRYESNHRFAKAADERSQVQQQCVEV